MAKFDIDKFNRRMARKESCPETVTVTEVTSAMAQVVSNACEQFPKCAEDLGTKNLLGLVSLHFNEAAEYGGEATLGNQWEVFDLLEALEAYTPNGRREDFEKKELLLQLRPESECHDNKQFF